MRENGVMSGFEFVIHPGKILKEDLKAINMTQRELSKRTGINKTIISELINGKRNMTLKIALKLEPIFEMPVSYWLNLQILYTEAKMKNISMVQIKTTENFKQINDNSIYLIESNFYNIAV